MLCRRTLELLKDLPGPPRSLIPREELEDWEQANQVLRRANAQADQLINLADRQCEALLEKASLEIWQHADVQLKRWERDRQVMCDSLEQYATAITHQTLRCLLDETPAPKRLAALLKQLLRSQVQEIDAMLLCHPHDLEEMKQCLANQKATIWKLHADETITPQTLVLKTDEGDFRISWPAMVETFFNQGKEYRINI